ncbi:MAG: hypothetical protein ACLR78_14765 [Roseburia sp.]
MINEDTIYLLRECNAGTQMAVYSIGEILENVKDQKLREILISSKTITNSLATNCIFCCRNTAIRQKTRASSPRACPGSKRTQNLPSTTVTGSVQI